MRTEDPLRRLAAEGAAALAGEGTDKEAVEEAVGGDDLGFVLDLSLQLLEVAQLAGCAFAASHVVDAQQKNHHTDEQENHYHELYECV